MIIENKKFDAERALYNLKDSTVKNCTFAGEADGESQLKEARNIKVEGCNFSLRYQLWHVSGFTLCDSNLDEFTRAPIWYSRDGEIKNTSINSVKAVRECENIVVCDSDIDSIEFGWKCKNIRIENSKINSQYMLFDTDDVYIRNLDFTGKYSFQYMKNLVIEDSNLDTKDAFWHSENITVKNSVVKGEYLAWFSKNLTLIDCTIIGTQPLCYCENLKLINCKMIDTDLSFEYSSVEADVIGDIVSVKNVRSGYVIADSIGEIINEDAVMECCGEVKIR